METKDDLIYDNGKLRNCTTNIAKLTVHQYIKVWGVRDLWDTFVETWVTIIKEGLPILVAFIVTVIFTLLFPISFPVMLYVRAILNIREAKKQLENFTPGGLPRTKKHGPSRPSPTTGI